MYDGHKHHSWHAVQMHMCASLYGPHVRICTARSVHMHGGRCVVGSFVFGVAHSCMQTRRCNKWRKRQLVMCAVLPQASASSPSRSRQSSSCASRAAIRRPRSMRRDARVSADNPHGTQSIAT